MESVVFAILDVLHLLLILVLWSYTLRKYKSLPEKVPTHIDIEGKPDRFGHKKLVFLLPSLGLAFWILLLVLTQNPESANYPVKITETNAEIQFFIMVLLTKWMLFLILLLFLNIQDFTIRYSCDPTAKARVHILIIIPIIFISIMTAIITAYIYR